MHLLRPHQWLKNMLLLFPAFFGGKMLDPLVLAVLLLSLGSFSLAASSSYIINDIVDRKYDKKHDKKKIRPLACGKVSIPVALLISVILFTGALVIGSFVSDRYVLFLIIYALISISYSLYFKNIIIVDIFFIASGFVIRVLAGGAAFNIAVTNWLLLTVFIVALFLAAGKRLGEMISLGDRAEECRSNVKQYSPEYLKGILWLTSAAALVTYSLYVIENRSMMIYTVPVAAFGLLRYIYVVNEGKGDPTDALLHDRQIMATGVIWAGMISYIIYR